MGCFAGADNPDAVIISIGVRYEKQSLIRRHADRNKPVLTVRMIGIVESHRKWIKKNRCGLAE